MYHHTKWAGRLCEPSTRHFKLVIAGYQSEQGDQGPVWYRQSSIAMGLCSNRCLVTEPGIGTIDKGRGVLGSRTADDLPPIDR